MKKVAEFRGWKYDADKSKRSGRTTYKTEFGYAVIDKSHGQFEYHDEKGKHQGQYNIEGDQTKRRNPDYDMKVK